MRMGVAAQTAITGNYPTKFGLTPSIKQTQSMTVRPMTESPEQFLSDYAAYQAKNETGAFSERRPITPKNTMESMLTGAEISGQIAGSIALGAGMAAYQNIRLTDIKYLQKNKPIKPTTAREKIAFVRNDGGIETKTVNAVKSGHVRSGEYVISTRRLLQPKPDTFTIGRTDAGLNTIKSANIKLNPLSSQTKSTADTALGKAETKGIKIGTKDFTLSEGGSFKATDATGKTQTGIYTDKTIAIGKQGTITRFSARGMKGLEYIRTEGININVAAKTTGGSSGTGTTTLTKTMTDTASLNLLTPSYSLPTPTTTTALGATSAITSTTTPTPAKTKSPDTRLVTTMTDTALKKTGLASNPTKSISLVQTTSYGATRPRAVTHTKNTQTTTTLKTSNLLTNNTPTRSTTTQTGTALKIDTGLKQVNALDNTTALKTPAITTTTSIGLTGITTTNTINPFLQVPLIGLPQTSGLTGGGGSGNNQRTPLSNFKQKKQYTPSVAAWFTGATTNIIPKGLFTGAEIRPIITKRKRKK